MYKRSIRDNQRNDDPPQWRKIKHSNQPHQIFLASALRIGTGNSQNAMGDGRVKEGARGGELALRRP